MFPRSHSRHRSPVDMGTRPTKLVDLSHVISEGLSTYPGLPAPHIFEHLDRAAAEEFYGPVSRSRSA